MQCTIITWTEKLAKNKNYGQISACLYVGQISEIPAKSQNWGQSYNDKTNLETIILDRAMLTCNAKS